MSTLKAKSLLSSEVKIMPQAMTVKAMALRCRDLHKIRAPVGICEGFDITEFDRLIEVSMKYRTSTETAVSLNIMSRNNQ